MCNFSGGETKSNKKLVADTGMKSENLNNNGSSGDEANNNGLKDFKDDDDFFSSVGFNMTGRPTMISAKYLQKEERRKVLKISVNKLKKIEDPESSLRRSVLINNTMKRLQRETREEKQKNCVYKKCYLGSRTNDSVQSIRSQADQLVDITNLPELNTSMTTSTTTTTSSSLKSTRSDCSLGCQEPMPDLLDSITSCATPAFRCTASRKRSVDDVEDCDVTDVLSQFYMPPTPRLLTSISDDEDEELNVVDVDIDSPCTKKPRFDSDPDFSLSCELSSADRLKSLSRNQVGCNDLRTDLISDQDLLFGCSSEPSLPSSQSSYSCGHSSIFNDIQSVVFHNLIASLET